VAGQPAGGPRRRLRRGSALIAAAGLILCANASAAAAAVSVFPIPGSRLATPQTQISFRGIAPGSLGLFVVSASRTGVHTGHLRADSDGRGASFYPSQPFAAGEVVTVRTSLSIIGAHAGTFQFTVQRPAPPIGVAVHNPAPRKRGDIDAFYSRPDLEPARLRLRGASPGGKDIFLASMRGPVQWGPMIVDRRGQLVWFLPRPGVDTMVTDFRVQRYLGQPVLTWWQGFVDGVGVGVGEIFDRHYRRIATVRAGNGLAADLHEFDITPQGTALITAYRPVYWDGSARGAGPNLDVLDSTIQEIDIRTGNVLFEWDSLDHVPIQNSFIPLPAYGTAFDYFHVNSVEQDSDGNLIVSSRNTWAVYKINHTTGAVMWTLGGKHPSFTMGPGTQTAYQHDAVPHGHGLLTIFDNGAWPLIHPQSRVVLERVNEAKRKVTLVRALYHSPKLIASVEGSAQLFSNGNVFADWGQAQHFSEYNRRGRQLFDGRFVSDTSSYRAYKFSWHGQPDDAPAISVRRKSAKTSIVYVSWNGATDVTSWRILAGRSRRTLKALMSVRKRGFETAIRVRTTQPELSVEAIRGRRRVLAHSAVVAAHRSR
jgi:hypothetical protein